VEDRPDSWTRLFTAVCREILRFRWPLLVAVSLLTAFLAFQMRELRLETKNEIWFMEGDRSLELIRKFEDLFGNDDFVYILFETEDFFRRENIRTLGHLAKDLEASVPYLLDVTWLGNAEYIEGREERIDIYELIEAPPESPRDMDALRRKALAEPLYLNSLISKDGRVAGLLLELDDYPDDLADPRKEVAPAVRAVLARPEYAPLQLHAVGGPLLDYDIDVLTAREASLLGVLCLLVQASILFWVGRGLRAVLVPMLVVILTIVWTFGMISLLGLGLNLFVIMVPVLLICVGIGDSMHVIAEFEDQRRQGLARCPSLIRTLGLVGLPCFLTSLTTAAGFLSFLSAGIKPFREMGLYCTVGVLVAVLLTYVLVPILYSWDGRRAGESASPGAAPRDDLFDRFLAGVYRIVMRHPRKTVGIFLGLFGVSVIGYARVEVESNFIEVFSEKVPIRRSYDHVDDRMGGTMSVEMMLKTKKTDGIADPDFLKRMDALDRFVSDHPLTTKTMSVLDILKRMRRAFNENRKNYYSVPETRPEAAQFLLLYETSGGEDREKYVTFNNDVARLTARTHSLDTRTLTQFMDEVSGFARDVFGESYEVEFTGMLSWIKAMNDLIGQGQRRSFITAFLVITLIMMAVLRSVVLGLISMIPNVFPVFMALGLMGFSGIYMDVGMMTFSAIIIGVAVDATIHFFVRYRREFERLGSYSGAMQATLSTVGRPITFTTLTLTLGFSVLALSNMYGLVHFGLLAGFAFSWALLADFFFAPALVLLLEPLGPELAVGR
jgi:hydrophobe/amphiphile efflux-3 (HAE3) family protein